MAFQNSSQLWRLCLQRPLIIVIMFALITCFMFLILQNIAASDNSDGRVHSPELTRRTINANLDLLDPQQILPESEQESFKQEPPSANDLLLRIDDLKKIKYSVSNELRALQVEKNKILKEKSYLLSRNEKIQAQIAKSKQQLKQFELDISANKRQRSEQACASFSRAPIVFNPMSSVDLRNYSYLAYEIDNSPSAPDSTSHREYQLDYSLCSLTQEFKFNVIKGEEQTERGDQMKSNYDDDDILSEPIQMHRRLASIGEEASACLTVIPTRHSHLRPTILARNALIINLSGQPVDVAMHRETMSKSLVASASFVRGSFRDKTDIVIPSVLQPANSHNSIIGSLPVQSPPFRKYLASYFGDDFGDINQASSSSSQDENLKPVDRILQTIHRSSIDDMFLFIYNCGPRTNQQCFSERDKMIEMSTFTIIIPDDRFDIDANTNDLIYLTLSRGAIPVIIGKERVSRLPFDEVIDWRRASVMIPTARLPELHFILRSLDATDIYSLKYHGRRIFENYLATAKQIFDSLISLISLERLNIPPLPIENIKTDIYYASSALNMDLNCTQAACQDAKSDTMINLLSSETFGPREAPFASPKFRRNLSLALMNSYALWNDPLLTPHHLYPSNPNDPLVPSEFKYLVNDQGYRPIGEGQGGSGSEFSQAIGGDRPNEQFTIVILTYERINLLMKTLERLRGLAYLNKILVVWNGINQPPQASLVWPDVGVPIVLVKVDKNSLNNRFLPYDAIETDAIFSMDDDSPLRPDEIVFAFRVWRESRDRIVGFPGRFHAWDSFQNSWIYNSNHSCELSMVLTGGAFFHRYYTHVYSLLMPESIRTVVDKFMNCEDIAMNFLVAHLTRKPPIKVTSRWTFHCANCPTSLSEDQTHFMERHECLNIFASIYGYMPLLNTQHRSDSILFKTRLPRDKQKCFKFV